MDCHAAPPPEYLAGGDSKRENLCQQDSERVTKTTPGACSGRQVPTEGPSSEKKVHLHQILIEKIQQEVRRSCKEFQSAQRGIARFSQSSIGQ